MCQQDYYTQGRVTPTPEQQQDFVLLNATEQNGVTSLTFSRKRNTSDPQDVAIQVRRALNISVKKDLQQLEQQKCCKLKTSN